MKCLKVWKKILFVILKLFLANEDFESIEKLNGFVKLNEKYLKINGSKGENSILKKSKIHKTRKIEKIQLDKSL